MQVKTYVQHALAATLLITAQVCVAAPAINATPAHQSVANGNVACSQSDTRASRHLYPGKVGALYGVMMSDNSACASMPETPAKSDNNAQAAIQIGRSRETVVRSVSGT